ncbi:glycoside hydrolase family 19 protein [Phaeodactylibacter xiamenensis]|uniref:glycoside hydrolase family 19 protein n=1 Tax=Phaeodactylibacter xiamenensis TaxID=1524460 RepID=UPI0024A9EECE|nr:glycoside hydrolase family 19 protein [Phaeodactylibacter xiamenensis]
MENWKKYTIIGVFVFALLLVSTTAIAKSRQLDNKLFMRKDIWIDAAEEAWQKLDSVQRDSVEQILRAFREYGDGDYRKLVYILATAWHESKLKPVRERRAGSSQTWLRQLQDRYWSSGYYGRGFVQLTWESNYKKMSEFLGVDLVGNPDLALEPRYAADILVYGMMNGEFTRRALSRYINLVQTDYYNARRVVNGTDRADLIRDYAVLLQTQIRKAV